MAAGPRRVDFQARFYGLFGGALEHDDWLADLGQCDGRMAGVEPLVERTGQLRLG